MRALLTGPSAGRVSVVHAPEAVPMAQSASAGAAHRPTARRSECGQPGQTRRSRRGSLGREQRRLSCDLAHQAANPRRNLATGDRHRVARARRADRALGLWRERGLPSRMARAVRHHGRGVLEGGPEGCESARGRAVGRRRTHEGEPTRAGSGEAARSRAGQLHRQRRGHAICFTTSPT